MLACSNNDTFKHRYYIAKIWDKQYYRIPLYEPLVAMQSKYYPGKWNMSFNDLLSNNKSFDSIIGANVDSISSIGADKGVVYGYINKTYYTSRLDWGRNGFIDNNGYMSFSSDSTRTSSNETKMKLIDSTNAIFQVPERWFIINTNDTSFYYIFNEDEYKHTLKDFKITEPLYDIDEIYGLFSSTGILPWFPDHIKTLLNQKP